VVERYLRERFLVEDAFSAQSGIGTDELRALIARGLAPGPAYDVDERGNMRSLVFGTVAAPAAPAGRWFDGLLPHIAAQAAIAGHPVR